MSTFVRATAVLNLWHVMMLLHVQLMTKVATCGRVFEQAFRMRVSLNAVPTPNASGVRGRASPLLPPLSPLLPSLSLCFRSGW